MKILIMLLNNITFYFRRVNNALSENGEIMVIENFTDKIYNKASLLSLNMALMCKSYERAETEYKDLLKKVGFKIIKTKKLNELQYIIICKK